MKRFYISLLLVLVLWGAEYAFRGYWEPDEPRFVLIAHEMEAAGKACIPIRNGVIYAHKPPLMMWLIQLGESVFPKILWIAPSILSWRPPCHSGHPEYRPPTRIRYRRMDFRHSFCD